MSTSQNGWPVHETPDALISLDWISGRVVGGDVWTIFDHLCQRFDLEVENIRRDWSWGWAYRPIRGQTSGFSNHASGTAIDLNAPDHSLGVRGTFTDSQRDTIHRILADFDGVVRWGGDYSGRPDEMHFEINDDAAAVHAVAARLRGEDDMTPEQAKTLSDIAAGVQALQQSEKERAKNQAKRDAALRAEMRKRFKATDAQVDEILAAVDKP